MKTAPVFHVYLLGNLEQPGLTPLLAELGMEAKPLGDPVEVTEPALILVGRGQEAPAGYHDISFTLPVDASPSALRELLRVAKDNVELKRQVEQLDAQATRRDRQRRELNLIGIALSAEKDIDRLQAFILTSMRQLTHADGASLWLKSDDEGGAKLFLASSQNHSIDKSTYSAFKVPVDEKSVVGYAVSHGASQIYDDAYNPPPGKPVGGKSFDAQFGYRTKSMLTVPMRNYNNEVVGAVQLINAKRRLETRLTTENVEQEVVSFQPDDVEMIESIASETAIEQRDPSTAGHSGRVEGLTSALARAVTAIEVGKFRDVRLNEDQFKELRYACLLHDFGKVGVRERILVKAKKLMPGQLEVIQSRFEFVERSVQVKYATEKLEAMRNGHGSPSELETIDKRLGEELVELDRWLQNIALANEPSVLPEDKASMLEVLSKQTYYDMSGRPHSMLDEQEFRFLSIRKGTLDAEERLEMESHVTHSFHFLTKIPWTPIMSGIPEIAYGHHEKLDGTGYPRRLAGDQIPLQARMMTISDIFDALTAQDRPYKRAVPVNTALDILHDEANKGQLDKDLLDVFIDKQIFQMAGAHPTKSEAMP